MVLRPTSGAEASHFHLEREPMTNQIHRELTHLRNLYHDLLMTVGSKWPGETRHETAKRYLLEAETLNSGPDSAQARHNLGLEERDADAD